MKKYMNNRNRKMGYFCRNYFEFLLYIQEVLIICGGIKVKKLDNKILEIRKAYGKSWKIIDKDGKVIEEFY